MSFDKLLDTFNSADKEEFNKSLKEVKDDNKSKDFKETDFKQSLKDSLKTINDIFSNEYFLEDFIFIKQNLKEDVVMTSRILNKIGEEISSSFNEDLNTDLIKNYSDLKNSNVSSLKLLLESYSKISDIQMKNKKISLLDSTKNETNKDDSKIFSTEDFIKKINEKDS